MILLALTQMVCQSSERSKFVWFSKNQRHTVGTTVAVNNGTSSTGIFNIIQGDETKFMEFARAWEQRYEFLRGKCVRDLREPRVPRSLSWKIRSVVIEMSNEIWLNHTSVHSADSLIKPRHPCPSRYRSHLDTGQYLFTCQRRTISSDKLHINGIM